MREGNTVLKEFVYPYLTNFGQIFLQQNPWAGLFFLAGIAVYSWSMLVGGLCWARW